MLLLLLKCQINPRSLLKWVNKLILVHSAPLQLLILMELKCQFAKILTSLMGTQIAATIMVGGLNSQQDLNKYL